jgi:HPt (histidine-containing phosphotransfer) domain-containing protein
MLSVSIRVLTVGTYHYDGGLDGLLDPDTARPRHIVELFLRLAPKDLDAIRDAADVHTLQRAAHKLKGDAAMLGLTRLHASCRAVDALGKQGDYAAARAAVADIERDFAATCDALRALIS